MIDLQTSHLMLEHLGREDRALLRSNPSARAKAGTQREGFGASRALFAFSCVSAGQAKNLGVRGGAPPPHVNRCAIWQYLQGLLTEDGGWIQPITQG